MTVAKGSNTRCGGWFAPSPGGKGGKGDGKGGKGDAKGGKGDGKGGKGDGKGGLGGGEGWQGFLGGGGKYVLFSTLPGEMIHFD